jgi:Protein of unknown function (DUF3089)
VTPRASAVFLAGTISLLVLVGSTALATSAGAAARPVRATSRTVWLCRPGQAGDPCAYPRTATSVTGSGSTQAVASVTSRSASRFDCFYVYPTVSTEPGNNADLTVQPAEKAAAILQASRFSQVCNVWAPMYRQATSAALTNGQAVNPAVVGTAYGSLLAAWKDYIAHDNHGRPIIFLGHSQGAAMLIKLLQAQVDPSQRLRRLMVSAIILGGNVQVPAGRLVGGSFKNIPACRSATQTGCVIAYSSFGSTPPAGAFFGRPGQGVSLQSGQTAKAGQQVVCVNPATFSAGTGNLQPYFLSATSTSKGVSVRTPWVTFPGLYTAQCQQSGGASWLQVTTTAAQGDPRPTVSTPLGPSWGYHLDDVNLALGNLVPDVARQEGAYRP